MQIIMKLQMALSKHSLISGLLAYGSAEFANRAVRLIVVIIMARQLSPELLGTAALTLTLFELIRILNNIGIGQQIITAQADKLEATCNRAYQLFWACCIIVAMIQLGVAALLAFTFGQMQAGQMLAILSGVYLLMPGGLVQCFLLMREKRLATTARIAATQNITDHIMTCILVILWPSPWAIILPKLCTAPIWLIAMRRAYKWKAKIEFGYAPIAPMLRFAISVLISEVFSALRTQGDKLIIGAMLGVSALGTYYFAYNASISIISMMITAFGIVCYPHMHSAKMHGTLHHFVSYSIMFSVIAFPAIIIGQYIFAPYYVPVIFGSNWQHAIPLMCVLTFACWPMFIQSVATSTLRINDKAKLDSMWSALACGAALLAVWMGSLASIETAATYWVIALYLVFAAMFLCILTPYLITYFFRNKRESLQ